MRMAEGRSNLTDLALDLGFADHSHFTNAFRREWGISPSEFRTRFRLPLLNPGVNGNADRSDDGASATHLLEQNARHRNPNAFLTMQ